MNRRDFDILKSFNVLYIEDDLDLLKNTTDVLEDFVNIIYPTSNTKDAFKVIKEKKIDVIISDILLENENAITFLRSLKKDHSIQIPAILTTAYTDTAYLVDAIQLKVENYIVKPISIKKLLNSMHDVLLPNIQNREIQQSYNIIKTIAVVYDGKQIEAIRFIISNLDENNIFDYSYTEIMKEIEISKPTLIKVFRQLVDKKILKKLQRSRYRFDENALNQVSFGKKSI